MVEDNQTVGEFATQLLEELGYSSIWVDGAQAALDLIEADPARFDLVFSDVVMPGMSGVELAQTLRETHPKLRVVLTSGYSHVLAEEGTHGFGLLRKPYSVEAPPVVPWGVILSAQESQEAAKRQARHLLESYGSVLDGESVAYVHARVPGIAQTRHVAQVWRETRAEAEARWLARGDFPPT